MPEPALRPLSDREHTDFAAALAADSLPTEDLDGGGRYFAWSGHDTPLAYGGLEGDGPDQLIRSVVVPPALRGGGHGRSLVEALARRAAAEGVERLWLLTLSAEGLFAGLGWTAQLRPAAPPAIASSREFTSLCPDSAVLMCRTLV